MGHHQVEALAATRSHKRVVALLGDGAGMAGLPGVGAGTLDEIADAMLEASLDGLERAKTDEGLIQTFYLLTQVTQAARADRDFEARLAALGVVNPAAAISGQASLAAAASINSIYDLVANFTNAVDQHLAFRHTRTDLGELAQRAAAQSITALCEDSANTLYGTGSDAVQDSLYRLSTRAGFTRLSHDFFSRLTSGFLIYNLSKELSNHVGPGRRFANVDEHNAFLDAMEGHCRTAASVLKDFSGKWYTRHNFEGGITPQKSFGFIGHALDKVRDALRHLGGSDEA